MEASGGSGMSSKDYFETVAPRWDAMRQEFFSTGVREKAYARAKLTPGMTVADVGAGNGFMSEGLLGRGLRVIAVDQSPAMLEEMRRRLGAEGIVYREGEAEHLPIADGELDCAFANMFLHHVEQPAVAVAELARTLRPGGRLVLTDLDAHSHAFLREEHHDRWLGFDRADIRRWFEAAGLRNVSVVDAGED
jgi:ubiquinone/menaquinone biosynthesis C-methylase UbiE